MLLYLFYLLCLIPVFSGQTTVTDKISPGSAEVSGTEGQPVSLFCEYETKSMLPFLHWFRQHPGFNPPKFLLFKGARNESQKEYILDDHYRSFTNHTWTELRIESPSVAHSDLYYCALEGLGYALIFSKPIKLTVTPKDNVAVTPSFFILRDLKDADQSHVCLATNLSRKPELLVLKTKEDLQPVDTSSAVLSTKTKSYYYAAFHQGPIESCSLKEMSSNSKADDKPNESIYPDDKHNESIYPEKARLRFYMMLKNGIRLIFTKAVAFNTILTIRALTV